MAGQKGLGEHDGIPPFYSLSEPVIPRTHQLADNPVPSEASSIINLPSKILGVHHEVLLTRSVAFHGFAPKT